MLALSKLKLLQLDWIADLRYGGTSFITEEIPGRIGYRLNSENPCDVSSSDSLGCGSIRCT